MSYPAHICLSGPVWLPHRDNGVLSMGLKRIEPGAWLVPNHRLLPAYIDNKRIQTARLAGRALSVLPQAASAVVELATCLGHSGNGHEGAATELFYQSSLNVAEDLCVLQPVDGAYALTAAHLCAPSHWCLEDKIGRAMDPIHATVPGYQPALARSVNQFLHKLKVGQFIERYNWSLDVTPMLCQRPASQPTDHPVLSWYRVERQTLHRLPMSGAVVFTIFVRHWPLWCVAEQKDGKPSLIAAINALPQSLRQYKNLDGAVLNWSKNTKGAE